MKARTHECKSIWGLAFKPGTDDMREASSRVILERLWARGVTVTAFDPVIMKESHHIYGERSDLNYAKTPLEALQNSDALVIVTEWKAFKSPDFSVIKSQLKQLVILMAAICLSHLAWLHWASNTTGLDVRI